MNKFFIAAATVALLCGGCSTPKLEENTATVTIAAPGEVEISRHIYGHFSEHLGHCIYDGLWVGKDSPIPNTGGVRNDIIAALKHIQIPNLRWPGGCFADEYHWMDGIGPQKSRAKMINTHWGGVVEDNAFGTHEFMNLCEVLETEPYICGNVGSGSVEEMSKWIEYMTFDGESPMANLRRKNGRDKAWKLKYFGVGNENWGCGGNMTPEQYAAHYRRYQTYCRNYGDNHLLKIVGGPSDGDTHWMEVMMTDTEPWMRWGVSLHHYSLANGWNKKGPATGFPESDYAKLMRSALAMEDIITAHEEVMDRYDPEARTAFVVDEWGAWYDVEPGTNPGFLFQQNTLRDALLAATTFNIFHHHARRVKMANIAQMVNVLQAIIFTQDEKMVLTPTYHIFDMYKVHHDARLMESTVACGNYLNEGIELPQVNVSASIDANGKAHISMVNIDTRNAVAVKCDLSATGLSRLLGAQILTDTVMDAHNTFEDPNHITLQAFEGGSLNEGLLTVTLPAMSVVTFALE